MNKFEIIITENYKDLSTKAAEVMALAINDDKNGCFGFATGSTPIGMYQHLIALNKEGKVDFSKVKTFNLDEYYPIQKSNNQSYDYFMKDNLFNHVNIDLNNVFIPNGEASDPQAECNLYEEKIKSYGGITMQLLGIGNNGHIGFNEPCEAFSKQTQLIGLTKSTIEANTRFFEKEEDVPKQALTMGIKTIMMSKKILMVITGASKAQIVKDFLKGEISPNIPASVLHLHQDVTIVLDKDSASKL